MEIDSTNQRPASARTWQEKSHKVLFGVLVALYTSFALAPLLTIVCLFVMSSYMALSIGHWPQPYADDPAYAAPGFISDILHYAVALILFWGVAGLITLPILWVVLTWAKWPRWWTLLLVALFIVGWLLIKYDLDSRIRWYLD